MYLTGRYKPSHWEETLLTEQGSGPRSTRVSAAFAFEGDLVGTARVDLLISYVKYDPESPHAAEAGYVGLLRFEGTHQQKKVSFAAIDEGRFGQGVAKSRLSVLAHSGTGEFARVAGQGGYEAGPQGASWTLEISMAPHRGT